MNTKRMLAQVRSMRQRANEALEKNVLKASETEAGRLALAEVAMMQLELERLERELTKIKLLARYKKGA